MIAIVAVTALGWCRADMAARKEKEEKPLVQIALLLDTSNSMDGLISQAKTQLWQVVNEFALAKRNGRRPDLRVALYEYGNDNLNKETGWIRCVVELSDDLDKISEQLFALKTRGGQEYCGAVIQQAVSDLKWSNDKDALRMIFIAGNEPFTQGHVHYGTACKAAVAKGITVNTIFCGNEKQGINTRWKDGAALADGSFMNINQNSAVAHISTPQDKKIAELGAELNKTYIPYGKQGKEYKMRQTVQDSNALKSGKGASVNRAVSKSSALYRNGSWDLVDAVRNEVVKVEEIKEKDLPENMQKMSVEERKKYVKEQHGKRAAIQKKISTLNKERVEYIDRKMKEDNGKDETLGKALIKAVRKQAAEKDYAFE